jgi:hypothetical protein
MDPTALPTDNLYKFAALSGVALIGFLSWLAWKTQRDLQAALLAITVKKRLAEVALERLKFIEKITTLKETQLSEKLADLEAEASGLSEANRKRLEDLKADFEVAETQRATQLDEQYGTRKTLAKLNASAEALMDQVRIFNRQRRQYTIATMAALAWSIGGFGLWYYKLQMPLDAKIKLEAEVATIELQIKKVALARANPAESRFSPARKQ